TAVEELKKLDLPYLSIFVVILGGLSRYFVAGYFSAMNIPLYRLQFPLWEYLEVAWKPLLEIFFWLLVIHIILEIMGSWVLSTITNRPFLTHIQKTITEWLERHFSFSVKWFAKHSVTKSLVTLIILYFLIFINGFHTLIFQHGESRGRSVLLDKSPMVGFTSTAQLDTSNINLVSEGIYQYDSLYLLTYNQQDYFFFEELDPETCQPDAVFIVNSNELAQVTIHSTTKRQPLDCTR
ncbi:MAG: hypothetical protein ACPG8W_25275, partial [Candidatus Promineifilaceae bacterium]